MRVMFCAQMDISPFIIQNLTRLIAMRGTTNRAVAEAAGLSHTVVRNIVMRRTHSPTILTLERIAKALDVTLGELLGVVEIAGDGIEVIGRVVAKAHIARFDGSHNNLPFRVRRPPQLKGLQISAVVVEGDCMETMYQAGHVLFFKHPSDGMIPPEDISKPCIVSDAKGGLSVRLLRPGNAPDRWHLIGLNQTSDPTWDADVEFASRILFVLPKDFVEIAK